MNKEIKIILLSLAVGIIIGFMINKLNIRVQVKETTVNQAYVTGYNNGFRDGTLETSAFIVKKLKEEK